MKTFTISFIFLLVFFTFALSTKGVSQKTSLDQISQAFKTGDCKVLGENFGDIIEMTVLEKDGEFKKDQAETILKTFFAKNPPKSFQILHKGGKDDAKYAIGNLTTENSMFRIYMLFKNKGEKQVISQLRIGKEKE